MADTNEISLTWITVVTNLALLQTIFNTGAELILLKYKSFSCISPISLRINEWSYNGLQYLSWLGTRKENGGNCKEFSKGTFCKGEVGG